MYRALYYYVTLFNFTVSCLRVRSMNSPSLPFLFLAKSGCSVIVVGLRLGLHLKGILLKLMLSKHISRIQAYYLLTDNNDCIKLET